MKLVKLTGIVCVLALIPALMSAPVHAFQETQITPDTAVKGDAPEKALTSNDKHAGAVELTTPSGDATSSEGIEIRIPGLGMIGKLPKLDFGLELLYGADANQENTTTAPDDSETDSDVMIRGTVKHRF